MFQAYAARLRLTRAQHARLQQVLGMQRALYNAALEERIGAWSKAGLSIGWREQFKSLTMIRSDDPNGYGALPTTMSRWTLKRLDEAMKGFFARVKRGKTPGFPRFRSRSRWTTLGFDEVKGVQIDRGRLFIKGVTGGMRLKLHRPLPVGGSIKAVTLSYDRRHWHAQITIEMPARSRHRHPNQQAGIDLGVEHLMTLSTGEHIANIRPRHQAERELRRRQRQLARCRRGSKRRQKVRARLTRLQQRIANRRRTHLHTVTKRIALRFGVVAVENLKTRNLTRSAAGTVETPGKNVKAKAGLNRALLDASPAMVVDLLCQKAESAAVTAIKVDPRYTSQDCSGCGERVPKCLSQRMHRCGCGLVLHRDVNAARNILARAVVRLEGGNGTQKGGRRPGQRLAA